MKLVNYKAFITSFLYAIIFLQNESSAVYITTDDAAVEHQTPEQIAFGE